MVMPPQLPPPAQIQATPTAKHPYVDYGRLHDQVQQLHQSYLKARDDHAAVVQALKTIHPLDSRFVELMAVARDKAHHLYGVAQDFCLAVSLSDG